MASLKESFAKGITTLNVKTNNFMEENKCKTYIATLEEEIRRLKQNIGEIIYDNRENVESVNERLQEIIKEITTKYEEIKGQEEKIKSLAETEQQILGTPNGMVAGAAGTTAEAETEVIYCSQCGMQNSVRYKFCCKCGKPLN